MVIPSEQLSIAYFCKWFLSLLLLPCCFHGLFVSLLLLDFSYVNKHVFSGSTINYKLTEHGQVLIWRPSARFDFLLPSYYGVNRCLSTRLGFQLQVVSTRASYNLETMSPVWFDYKSPVLYMVNPVFITTRHGFIINRHNMEGVISTQDLGYHPYYKKLVNQRCDSMSQV